MAYAIEPQIFQTFKGIRELNGINSGGVISALECNNVELVQTEIGSGVGIKTMDGNSAAYSLPEGYKVIGIYKSVQDDIIYRFIYGENGEKGTLFYIDPTRQATVIVDDLTVTGQSNGITMTSSAYDVFVFTNGVEVKTVCFTGDPAYGDNVKTINAVDYQGRNIHWLSMVEWHGFLVVASEYGVHSSHQNDIYTWNDNPQDVADSWYIDFSKRVIAVHAYTGGLYIFTQDDISYLNATPNNEASNLETVSGNGCFSYTSLVQHDTYLFFYDNRQKNIYYIQMVDTGQIRPAGPVAQEIQSQFAAVSSFKMFSCIYDNRNEIWCLINNKIFIYNYFLQEWVQRTEQNINTVCLINNSVLTGGVDGKIFVENINTLFNGEFFPAVYRTTFINMGSNTNLKKQKTPLLLALNDNYVNDFWIELTINNKTKNPKRVHIISASGGVYVADEDSEELVISEDEIYDSAVYAADNPYSKRVVEISTPQTWYTMSMKIYTDTEGQGFYINSMELKNIKAKTKTRGR